MLCCIATAFAAVIVVVMMFTAMLVSGLYRYCRWLQKYCCCELQLLVVLFWLFCSIVRWIVEANFGVNFTCRLPLLFVFVVIGQLLVLVD